MTRFLRFMTRAAFHDLLGHCNVGNGEDGYEPARRTDGLSAIQSAN
jgi:hypothetical protein